MRWRPSQRDLTGRSKSRALSADECFFVAVDVKGAEVHATYSSLTSYVQLPNPMLEITTMPTQRLCRTQMCPQNLQPRWDRYVVFDFPKDPERHGFDPLQHPLLCFEIYDVRPPPSPNRLIGEVVLDLHSMFNGEIALYEGWFPIFRGRTRLVIGGRIELSVRAVESRESAWPEHYPPEHSLFVEGLNTYRHGTSTSALPSKESSSKTQSQSQVPPTPFPEYVVMPDEDLDMSESKAVSEMSDSFSDASVLKAEDDTANLSLSSNAFAPFERTYSTRSLTSDTSLGSPNAAANENAGGGDDGLTNGTSASDKLPDRVLRLLDGKGADLALEGVGYTLPLLAGKGAEAGAGAGAGAGTGLEASNGGTGGGLVIQGEECTAAFRKRFETGPLKAFSLSEFMEEFEKACKSPPKEQEEIPLQVLMTALRCAEFISTAYNMYSKQYFFPKEYLHKIFASKNCKPSERLFGFVEVFGDVLFVILRGTADTQDWVTNLRAVLTRDRRQAYRGFYPMMHRGFREVFDDLKTDVPGRKGIFTLIRDCMKLQNITTIVITGHSQGAALATLCAYELISFHKDIVEEVASVNLYTLASPRVLDPRGCALLQDFFQVGHSAYGANHAHSFHVHSLLAQLTDLVVHVPPDRWGFRHFTRSHALLTKRLLDSLGVHSIVTFQELLWETAISKLQWFPVSCQTIMWNNPIQVLECSLLMDEDLFSPDYRGALYLNVGFGLPRMNLGEGTVRFRTNQPPFLFKLDLSRFILVGTKIWDMLGLPLRFNVEGTSSSKATLRAVQLMVTFVRGDRLLHVYRRNRINRTLRAAPKSGVGGGLFRLSAAYPNSSYTDICLPHDSEPSPQLAQSAMTKRLIHRSFTFLSIGNELVERTNPVHGQLPQVTAIMDPELVVTLSGVIRSWGYHAHKSGEVVFQVYRPRRRQKMHRMGRIWPTYEIVGQTRVHVLPGLHTHELQEQEQLPVEQGDVLGYAFDHAVQDCPLSFGPEEGREVLGTRSIFARGLWARMLHHHNDLSMRIRGVLTEYPTVGARICFPHRYKKRVTSFLANIYGSSASAKTSPDSHTSSSSSLPISPLTPHTSSSSSLPISPLTPSSDS